MWDDDFEEFEVDEAYEKALEEKYRYWYWIDQDWSNKNYTNYKFELDK